MALTIRPRTLPERSCELPEVGSFSRFIVVKLPLVDHNPAPATTMKENEPLTRGVSSCNQLQHDRDAKQTKDRDTEVNSLCQRKPRCQEREGKRETSYSNRQHRGVPHLQARLSFRLARHQFK